MEVPNHLFNLCILFISNMIISNSSEGYVKRRANFSRHSTLQSITCIAPLEMKDSFVTGTVSGVLFQWTDRNCIRTVKGHQVRDVNSMSRKYSLSHIAGLSDSYLFLHARCDHWGQRPPGEAVDATLRAWSNF